MGLVRMNYEAKVTDLSGAESVLIDDVELDGRRQCRGRLLIALAIVVALLIGGALRYFGSGEEAPFQPQQGNQVPTVSVVRPGATTETVGTWLPCWGWNGASSPLPK